MLHISYFTFNAFQENMYIIYNDEKQCWIVDPGMYDNSETQELIDYISKEQLHPMGIINTHAHLDHIFGVQAIIDAYKIPFSLHEKELPVLKQAMNAGALWGFPMSSVPQPDHFIDEHKTLILGVDTIHVKFTPGHSPGSIIFYYPDGKWAIGGDVLFAGGIGRTDLPGGDHQTLLNSIHTQLFTLPDETTVFPGHGPATTIGQERLYNPFLS